MTLDQTFHDILEGRATPGMAGLAALLGFIVAFAAAAFVIRPLVRLLSSHDPEKIAEARRRRIRFGANGSALALAALVFFHAHTAPELRFKTLPFQVSLLALVVMTGFLGLELLLALFADFLPHRQGRPPHSQFFKDVIRTIVILALVMVGAKSAFPGTDIGQLVTTSAILSLVIGLALQESLSNVFSGLMLTIDEPYKPGDWIEIDGKEGKVLDSNWRSVRVLTRDDDVIYVPNSNMAKHNVVNFTAPTPLHLVKRKIGVEYGAPPNKVKQVLISLMQHTEGVLKEPPPDVYIADYADFSITYEMRFWIDVYASRTRIESEVMRGVWYHLKRNRISIPFPIQDVYLKREKPEVRPEEIVALLRRVDILAALKDDEQRMLADDLTSQLFAKNEIICRQGDEGSTFYIIKSGKVSVRVKQMDSAETEVAQLGPGAFFGEMSLLTGEPRSSTVRAAEDCELLCLDRESFAVLLKDNPPIAQTMSEIIAERQAAKDRHLKERDTKMVGKLDVDERKSRIFESIKMIFRFR
ncbi:MAG: mechanosensitive ion channel family protein [Planctomycetes bacterium]|nr:mechanosensitive ion channel family protein [Planctomycetota bacterium]